MTARTPTLTTRTQTIPTAALGRAHRDRRTADQYQADLERETEASLTRDPTRWSWMTLGNWQSRKWREA